MPEQTATVGVIIPEGRGGGIVPRTNKHPRLGRADGPLLSSSQMRRLIQQLSLHPAKAEIVPRRHNRMIARLRLTSEETVIAKLWDKPGIYGAIGRTAKCNTLWREWRALRRLHPVGVGVPRPLGRCEVNRAATGYTDALFIEDLGQCPTVAQHVKRLMREGQEDLLRRIEDDVIELTHAIISAGFTDRDHGMHNMLLLPSGEIRRIDLERSRRVFPRFLAARSCGAMLGHLIAMHACALQPNVARVHDFAVRLASRIGPPRSVLRRTRRWVERAMDRQRTENGIDTRVEMPW